MEKLLRYKHKKYKYAKQGMAFVLPAVCWIFLFVYIPLIMALFRVFQNYQTHEFVGFENFDYVLKTPAFINSFKNVLIFTVVITFLMVILSFLFASLLASIKYKKLTSAVKTFIYIPNLMSGVIVAIIFNLLLNTGYGLFACLRSMNGKYPIDFSNDGIWPYLAIIIPTLWIGLGYNTLIMLAGRLNIPKEYYDAAEIDGAGWFDTLIHITIPSMKNYFILIITSQIIGNLQMLEIPMWITGGNDKTMTPNLYLFNTFRDSGRSPNVAIAGSLIIMVIIATINIIAFSILHSKKGDE